MAAMIMFIMLWTFLQGFLFFHYHFSGLFYKEWGFFITLTSYPSHHFKVHSFTFDHFHLTPSPPKKKKNCSNPALPSDPTRPRPSPHPKDPGLGLLLVPVTAVLCLQSWSFGKSHDMGGSKNGGNPQNGWFIWKTLLKWDDLGVPPFKETSTFLKETTLEGESTTPWN